MSITDLTAARLRRPGANGARILLIADRSWLETSDSPDEHRVPVRLLDRLWLSSRRGIELDVVCGVGRVLRILESFADAWNVGDYDAVVLLPDLGASPLPQRLQRVIDRIAEMTRVLGVCDVPFRAPAPGSAAGWRDVRIAPRAGECPAPLVAEAVSSSLLGVLQPRTTPRMLEAPKRDTVAEHLQRIAVIATSAFAVGSAAIAVLTAGRTRTLAAVGPALPDQACVRAAAVRPLLVLDAWHDTHLARDIRPQGEVRFFAAHPLELADGSAMGTISVFDTEPRVADEFDGEILRDLAVLASAELQYAGASV
ncbi:GAF domain-containing protein [Amnibacterium kyonggiense]|uniref:GAF domain-containing protein n=1 Tax=Amnibacterium kyonggiense TaxID=595671 RepID=A0A4R7FPR6_9MICO|nr:GAF domain-containing protein [Amnibacterium kyonggiense]TDS79628.1 hypothetical protein CLV52_0162 [Amnibacterium kyonggiense]